MAKARRDDKMCDGAKHDGADGSSALVLLEHWNKDFFYTSIEIIYFIFCLLYIISAYYIYMPFILPQVIISLFCCWYIR